MPWIDDDSCCIREIVCASRHDKPAGREIDIAFDDLIPLAQLFDRVRIVNLDFYGNMVVASRTDTDRARSQSQQAVCCFLVPAIFKISFDRLILKIELIIIRKQF